MNCDGKSQMMVKWKSMLAMAIKYSKNANQLNAVKRCGRFIICFGVENVTLKDLKPTQVVTVEAMFGKEHQQADGAQYGDGEQDLLPLDGEELLFAQRLSGIEDAVQLDGGQHVTQRADHERDEYALVNGWKRESRRIRGIRCTIGGLGRTYGSSRDSIYR